MLGWMVDAKAEEKLLELTKEREKYSGCSRKDRTGQLRLVQLTTAASTSCSPHTRALSHTLLPPRAPFVLRNPHFPPTHFPPILFHTHTHTAAPLPHAPLCLNPTPDVHACTVYPHDCAHLFSCPSPPACPIPRSPVSLPRVVATCHAPFHTPFHTRWYSKLVKAETCARVQATKSGSGESTTPPPLLRGRARRSHSLPSPDPSPVPPP